MSHVGDMLANPVVTYRWLMGRLNLDDSTITDDQIINKIRSTVDVDRFNEYSLLRNS